MEAILVVSIHFKVSEEHCGTRFELHAKIPRHDAMATFFTPSDVLRIFNGQDAAGLLAYAASDLVTTCSESRFTASPGPGESP